MSARNIKQQQSKPFCKVCQDAGKPEHVYTSHFVKSAPGTGGKVVCPTLLSLQCGYCFQSGHTPKFCPVIAKNKALEEKAKRREAFESVPQKEAPKKKQTNVFAALDSDNDSEPENVSKKQVITSKKSQPQNIIVAAVKSKEEEFPALPSTAKKALAAPSTPMSGYAAAAAKPVYDVEEFNNATSLKALQRQMPPLSKAIANKNANEDEDAADDDSWAEVYVPKPAPPLASQIDWTKLYDSDDEDW
jgi:hypothetical protein